MGEQLINLLQAVKRTNTPLIPQQINGVVDKPWVFGSWGSNPTVHNNNLFQTFRIQYHVEPGKIPSSPRYPQEMKPLGYILTGPSVVVVVVVVVVLTLTRIIKSVVTGQAPVTLELRKTRRGGKNTNKQPKVVHAYITADAIHASTRNI